MFISSEVCQSIFVATSMRIVPLFKFLSIWGMIIKDMTLWMINGDNLVRGGSSLDSNIRNLGKFSSFFYGLNQIHDGVFLLEKP